MSVLSQIRPEKGLLEKALIICGGQFQLGMSQVVCESRILPKPSIDVNLPWLFWVGWVSLSALHTYHPFLPA